MNLVKFDLSYGYRPILVPREQNFSKILIKFINLRFLIPNEIGVCLPTPVGRYFSNLATPIVKQVCSVTKYDNLCI